MGPNREQRTDAQRDEISFHAGAVYLSCPDAQQGVTGKVLVKCLPTAGQPFEPYQCTRGDRFGFLLILFIHDLGFARIDVRGEEDFFSPTFMDGH